MIKYIIIFFNCFLLNVLVSTQGYGQEEIKNIGNAFSFSISYGYYTPGGDMADRFGSNFGLGVDLEYLFEKSNLIIGADISFMFGNTVKEDVIASLRNEDNLILGTDGTYADIFLRERGLFSGITLGKIFPLSSVQKKSGIRVSISPGIMQHWIRIQDDKGTVPQVMGDYSKGYDRFSSGFGMKETIGYQILSNNGRINFYAGFDFIQGFTKNKRDINYDTQLKDDSSRTDFLWGFKLAWHIPFYFGGSEDEIFY